MTFQNSNKVKEGLTCLNLDGDCQYPIHYLPPSACWRLVGVVTACSYERCPLQDECVVVCTFLAAKQ